MTIDELREKETFKRRKAEADRQVNEAVDRGLARMALYELKQRHPEWDWSPPCPDCGSREHFECDR